MMTNWVKQNTKNISTQSQTFILLETTALVLNKSVRDKFAKIFEESSHMQMRTASRDINCKQRGVKFDTKIEGLLNYENFENSCRGEKN